MSFIAPVWDSTNSHYVIDLSPAFTEKMRSLIKKDENGSTVFTDMNVVDNFTDTVIYNLIEEGSSGNWFSKLPSHDQLMKRVRHSFKTLAQESENGALLTTLLLTPKVITFIWTPTVFTVREGPQISFEDSEESENEAVEITESDLPPVELVDDTEENEEEYLLTRLRAAKARVETEQIRMRYFEATGRMPPDSESEDE